MKLIFSLDEMYEAEKSQIRFSFSIKISIVISSGAPIPFYGRGKPRNLRELKVYHAEIIPFRIFFFY